MPRWTPGLLIVRKVENGFLITDIQNGESSAPFEADCASGKMPLYVFEESRDLAEWIQHWADTENDLAAESDPMPEADEKGDPPS